MELVKESLTVFGPHALCQRKSPYEHHLVRRFTKGLPETIGATNWYRAEFAMIEITFKWKLSMDDQDTSIQTSWGLLKHSWWLLPAGAQSCPIPCFSFTIVKPFRRTLLDAGFIFKYTGASKRSLDTQEWPNTSDTTLSAYRHAWNHLQHRIWHGIPSQREVNASTATVLPGRWLKQLYGFSACSSSDVTGTLFMRHFLKPSSSTASWSFPELHLGKDFYKLPSRMAVRENAFSRMWCFTNGQCTHTRLHLKVCTT